MSGPRGRVLSHTNIVIILFLILAGSICALLTFPGALAAPIVSDNFTMAGA